MTQADEYRMRAAEVRRRAAQETSQIVMTELEGIAAAYMRLASRADRMAARPPLKAVPEIRNQF
jgi:hypothetical protein